MTALEAAHKRPTSVLLWEFYQLTTYMRMAYPEVPRRGGPDWVVYEAERRKLAAVTKVLESRTVEAQKRVRESRSI